MARKGKMTVEEFARLGGLARARALSPERRSEIARAAIKARWARKKREKPDA